MVVFPKWWMAAQVTALVSFAPNNTRCKGTWSRVSFNVVRYNGKRILRDLWKRQPLLAPNTAATTPCGSTKRPTFTSANRQQQVLGSLACPYRFECLFPLRQRKASAHQWSGFYLTLS